MPDIVRNILARFGMDYDDSNFKKLLDDTMQGVKELKKMGVSFQALNKAQQQLNTKQLATESKQLVNENRKAALINKQLTAELKKAALADKALVTEAKRLTVANKQAALESKQLTIKWKQQDRQAKELSATLRNLRDGLIGVGVLTAARFVFNIALKTERAVLRIQNLIDKTVLARLEKRFDVLNKQNRELFSKKDFKESAAAVLLIDRNVGFFAKSLDFAIKKAPILGKTLREIQEGLAEARVFGDEQALIELGLITPLALEEQRRRTGIAFGELRPEERTNMILNLMKLSSKQLQNADAATRGLNASWNRFNKLIEDAGEKLTEDFKPAMIFLLEGTVDFLRLLAASPIGLFFLRLGGLIAGLATLTLGLGVLTKAMLFFRLASLKAHKATLLLFGKFLLYGALIAGLVILIDDLWVTITGGPKADTLFNRLGKFLKKFFKDIGLDDFVKSIDDWLENIVNKGIDKLTEFGIWIKNFFTKDLGKILNDFFDNIGFTDLTAKIDKFLDDTVGKFLKMVDKVGKLLNIIGIGPGAEESAFSLLPEVSGLGATPRLNTTPPGRQLSGLTPSMSNVDNSTSLNFGSNNLRVQAGANKEEIISVAVDRYKLFLEQQLNEAQIGGR